MEFYGIQIFHLALDLLAVPEFMAGAMEDWGLVSFRSAYIVYDEKLSTIEQKRQVTLVIAHELAHQVIQHATHYILGENKKSK